MPDEPSRSYIKPIPIVTTYEPELADNASSLSKRRSASGSVKAPSAKAPSVKRAASAKAESTSGKPGSVRAPSRAGSVKAPSLRAATAGHNGEELGSPVGYRASQAGVEGATVGELVSAERQRELQGHRRVSLVDPGINTEGEGDHPPRAMSPRPMSSFGHRPQPNLMSVAEDGRESRYDGRDSRMGLLNRSGTVVSRANTLGRNNTLSRAANGGTVGSRRGAFGRGAGASIGTQPEEVLGRE